ncbi:19724_t:CDS:2, partial [Racocetra fulgida]
AAALKDQLVSRLQFLQWVANYEAVPFFTSTAQTDVIWRSLIADPIGKQEQDEAFSYLDNIIEYDHFISHFFNNRLSKLDVRYFSDQAFKYTKNCLLKVNTKNSRLRSASPTTQSQSQSQLSILVQGDLIGIDLIWDIALRAEEEAVGKEAIVFLVYLHLNVSKNYTTLSRQHREALVDKCVGHLFAAANGLSNSLLFPAENYDLKQGNKQSVMLGVGMSDETQILSTNNETSNALKFKRCLQVLKSFMDLFDTKYSHSQIEQRPIRRHGMLNDGEMITVKVTINNASTVLSLRQKVASRIGAPRPGSIRLFFSGKELHSEDNATTLKKLKVVDRQAFMATKRASDARNGQDNEKAEISSDEEILDWLLRGGDETTNGDEWSILFVENGGLDYLLSLLTMQDAANDIENFAGDHQKNNSPTNSEVFRRFDSNILIAKLIDIIGKCVDPSQYQALSSFIEFQGLREWLMSALVGCRSEEARNLLEQNLLRFCEEITSNATFDGALVRLPPSLETFLTLLWSFLPDVENYVDTSKEYFELMGHLMPYITKSARQFNSPNEDTVIVGLIQLMTIIIAEHPEFKRLPNDEYGSVLPPKCKLEASRTAALDLLNELVKDCPENCNRETN